MSHRKKSDLLRDKILTFFSNSRNKDHSIKDVNKKLQLARKDDRKQVEEILTELVTEGKLMRHKNGTFQFNQLPDSNLYVTGRVDHVNARFCYVVTSGDSPDIWVSERHMHGAIDGDIVNVVIFPQTLDKKDKSPEGNITEIVERTRTEYVGKITISPKFAFVVPDNKKTHRDIFVPQAFINGAQTGDKVVVKITQWPEDRSEDNPVGDVIKVLGKAGTNDVEMHAILAEFGLPSAFPTEVEFESEHIDDRITQEEIKKRRDFRNVTTFTIDPYDAKDFDDALSILKLPNGNWEIGVHIADVTHYVRLDTALEKEAYARATSVYLVDRVVPMLPEKLSNGLCSLRPKEDKLTFSAVFELNEEGQIQDEWFGKTIIHSDRRFTYEEVQEMLEGAEGEFKEEVLVLNKLAHKLRAERFRKGAITFETIEVKFRLDEKGTPLEVVPKVRKDAHKLIEDFMLLANRKVAEYVHFMKKGKEKNTMVFRIHEHPDPDKLTSLAVFAKKFGHILKMEDEHQVAHELNKLQEEVEGKPEQNVLQSLAIRTMSKARYSTDPEIHFGLAYKHYTHFTSPIRRYPDMMVHRLLFHYLNNGKSADKAEYDDKCKHSSEREKMAAEAERASIKYKQVEFMSILPNKVYEGIISGVIETGIFVEIVETRCEGMIRLADMDDDYYDFDQDNYRIIGKRRKKIYTLGDRVMVQVKKTDLQRRTMDLILADIDV